MNENAQMDNLSSDICPFIKITTCPQVVQMTHLCRFAVQTKTETLPIGVPIFSKNFIILNWLKYISNNFSQEFQKCQFFQIELCPIYLLLSIYVSPKVNRVTTQK